jgi:hypothetical protein
MSSNAFIVKKPVFIVFYILVIFSGSLQERLYSLARISLLGGKNETFPMIHVTIASE